GQEAAAAPAPAPASAGPSALLGNTELGNMLVGSDGRTLYGFTNDTGAASTCYGGCAEAWPPIIVGQDWEIGPGLDLGIFATTVRDDGQLQLVAGKWPLYYYAGDAVSGDINGQGSGDVWFAVDTAGILITDGAPAAPADPADGSAAADPADSGAAAAEDGGGDDGAVASPIATGTTDLGEVLTDGDGLTLYGFTNDVDGLPTCEDGCAEAWPPLTADAVPAGLDPALFTVAARPDGETQLVAGKWPLYRFAGDAAPGDINGQGSGGVWFAVAPDGSLIKSADQAGGSDEAGSDDGSSDASDGADTGSDGGSSDDGY
ncbi:MAG: hypothetical protein ACR2QK_22575, partial [Acidimicrobiales bacterium]